jgi:hypothetical protein
VMRVSCLCGEPWFSCRWRKDSEILALLLGLGLDNEGTNDSEYLKQEGIFSALNSTVFAILLYR